jgi:hypothetical protein
MNHVVAMKCLICLPLLIHIELLWRRRSRKFCVPNPQPWFGVLTAMQLKFQVLWVVTQCHWVNYRRFEGALYLRLQGQVPQEEWLDSSPPQPLYCRRCTAIPVRTSYCETQTRMWARLYLVFVQPTGFSMLLLKHVDTGMHSVPKIIIGNSIITFHLFRRVRVVVKIAC